MHIQANLCWLARGSQRLRPLLGLFQSCSHYRVYVSFWQKWHKLSGTEVTLVKVCHTLTLETYIEISHLWLPRISKYCQTSVCWCHGSLKMFQFHQIHLISKSSEDWGILIKGNLHLAAYKLTNKRCCMPPTSPQDIARWCFADGNEDHQLPTVD